MRRAVEQYHRLAETSVGAVEIAAVGQHATLARQRVGRADRDAPARAAALLLGREGAVHKGNGFVILAGRSENLPQRRLDLSCQTILAGFTGDDQCVSRLDHPPPKTL